MISSDDEHEFSSSYELLKSVYEGSDVTIKKTMSPNKNCNYFRVIVRITTMIAHYQLITATKFKNSLEYKFDKKNALRVVASSTPSKLVYLIRKFELTFDDLRGLDLLPKLSGYGEDADDARYLFSVALKYLCRNSNGIPKPVSARELLDLIKNNANVRVKSELIWSLAYVISNSDMHLKEEIWSSIFKNNQEDLDSNAIAFLSSKLESFVDENIVVTENSTTINKETITKRKKKAPAKKNQFVSKSTQLTKSTVKNRQSEETSATLDLANALKRRARKCNLVVALEPIETINDKSGDDRSIFRNTWHEVVNLYNLGLKQNETIKSGDKDDYLPRKLFGTHVFGVNQMRSQYERKLYHFFVNRMIVCLLLHVSKKQLLHTTAVDKLMKCVVNFSDFLKLAIGSDDEEGIYDGFIQAIYNQYSELKDLGEPDILNSFFKMIMNSTFTVTVSKGWIYNSTEKKFKDYDKPLVRGKVKEEIEKLRLGAVSALYYTAQRKPEYLTKERIQSIEDCLENSNNEEDTDEKFKNTLIKMLSIVESSSDVNYKRLFKIYVGLLKTKFDTMSDNLKLAINFILDQSRDPRRCEDLFSDRLIDDFFIIFERSKINQVKEHIVEIVNNYLEHTNTKGLNEKNLLRVLNYILANSSSLSEQSNNGIMLAVLLTVRKTKILPEQVTKHLAMNVLTSNIDFLVNYSILILNELNPESIKHANKAINHLLVAIDSDYALVEQNDDLFTFVKVETEEEQIGTSIALLAAQLMIKLVDDNCEVEIKTFEMLLSKISGGGGEKQMRIVLAKCIERLSKRYAKNMAVDTHVLSQLQLQFSLDRSSCYDISVYMEVTYARVLCVLASEGAQPLDDIHLENLSSMQIYESLRVNEHDFAQEINTIILEILKFEAAKKFNEFSDGIFQLINDAIVSQKYAEIALEVLEIYTSTKKGNTIPVTIIESLENILLGKSRSSSAAFFIIQNVILNGQVVTHRVLKMLVDWLYGSSNSRRRLRAFKLLEKASQSQMVPDDIFLHLELVRAGFGLQTMSLELRPNIIEFLVKETERGSLLPIDTMLALEKMVSEPQILVILRNCTSNKQILDYELLNKLSTAYNPETDVKTSYEMLLLSIFANIARNNQSLSRELLVKLEISFLLKENIPSDQERILTSIFVLRAQKGEHLSPLVTSKLLNMLEDSFDDQLLLSSLRSIIKMSAECHKEQLMRILMRCLLDSRNLSIQRLCIDAWQALLGEIQIDETCLDFLVDATVNQQDPAIRNLLYVLLNKQKLNENQRARIELSNVQSNDNLLNKLKKYNSQSFTKENYVQLAEILDSEDDSKRLKVLEMLGAHSKITDELFESIAVLFDSSCSREVKKLCMGLLKKRTTQTPRTQRIIYREENTTSQVNKRGVEFDKKFPTCKKSLFELVRSLDDTILASIRDVQTLMQVIVEQGLRDYYNNEAFVFLIEQHLLQKMPSPLAIFFYIRIVKEKKCSEQLSAIIEHLVEQYEQVNQCDLVVCICRATSIKYFNLSNKSAEFLVDHLNSTDEFIRWWCFKALRSMKTRLPVFEQLCHDKIKRLVDIKMIDESLKYEENLDILEVLLSLQSLDLNLNSTMLKHGKLVWLRELIVGDLFAIYDANGSEQINFYTHWLNIESKTKESSLHFLMSLRHAEFESMQDINESLYFIRQLEKYDHEQVFQPGDYDVHENLMHLWCSEMIKRRLKSPITISNVYVDQLAHLVCSRFLGNVRFIGKFFEKLTAITNVRAIENFIDFCTMNNVSEDELAFLDGVDEVREFSRFIELKRICHKIPAKTNEKRFLLNRMLFVLSKKLHWSNSQLDELVEEIQKSSPQNLIDILKIIYQYELFHTKFSDVIKIVKEEKASLKHINKLAVENSFQQEGKMKNNSELIEELIILNADNEDLVRYIRTQLGEQLDKIKSGNFKARNFCSSSSLPINAWRKKHIGAWAKKMVSKDNKEPIDLVEAITVIKRANLIEQKFDLNDAQILCSLIALWPGYNSTIKKQGKLLQMATGEGKSTIVCVLAIFKALEVKGDFSAVDIITSSPVLAERDAKHKESMFKMFGLTCNHNADAATPYIYGPKECYRANIVYGEVSQFQFDRLRDEYSCLGTLADRNKRRIVAIVDEVDSMLIDDSSKIARLSSAAAGMDHFQPVYFYLWHQLISIKEKFIVFEDKMYLINGKVNFENGRAVLEYAENTGQIKRTDDLEKFFKEISFCQYFQVVNEDLDSFIQNSLDKYLTHMIEEKAILIPENFKEFYERQKHRWTRSAIEALYYYEENINYVVLDGQIKPVDYYSTGIVQNATNWGDGLHQFLQLKHNLKMNCETLTTNFLSNIGFIKSYEHVYGLTGTLGSANARNVLQEVYKVDLVNIPPSRQKQYHEFPLMMCVTESSWLHEICESALAETRKDRGVLVICETIQQANQIGERLRNLYRQSAVKLYTINNANQERQVDVILPGEIIIATNLAGRGTDIKTSEIESTGGLHVVLTYMPTNQRVEDQAFGRTARQGKRGTGQMILNMPSVISAFGSDSNVSTFDSDMVKAKRDAVEAKQLNNFKENELKQIELKDDMFKDFATFINSTVRASIRKTRTLTWGETISGKATIIMPSVYEQNMLSAIEEQWAMFLHKFEHNVIKAVDAKKECLKLIDRLKKEYNENPKSVIKNHYYSIAIGNDLIYNSSKPDDALAYYERAIASSDGNEFYAAAHAGKAWHILTTQKGSSMVYKNECLKFYQKSLEILRDEMAIFNAIQVLFQQLQPGFVHSALYIQLGNKSTILGSYMNSIQSCMDVINKSLRLIDVTQISKDRQNETVYFCRERDNLKWTDGSTYQLVFNDLSVYQDTWTYDQATQTIDKAKSSQSSIRLRLPQVNLERIKSLLDKNKLFEELDADSAIAKLKSEQGYLNMMNIGSSYKVDVTVLGSEKPETKVDQQINKVIELIEEREKKENQRLRYNLVIKEAHINSINKSELNVEVTFNELDCEKALAQLKLGVETTNFSVELIRRLTKKQLVKWLKSIKYIEIKSIRVCNKSEEKAEASCERIQMGKLEKFIQKIEEQEKKAEKEKEKEKKQENEQKQDIQNAPSYILIFDELETAEKVSSLIKQIHNQAKDENLTFNLTYKMLDSDGFWKLLKNDEHASISSFCFDSLSSSSAKSFIEVLRAENVDFCLEFLNLNTKDAKSIVENADLKQEHIKINKVKTLTELFMKGMVPNAELAEFSVRGIEFTLEINEKLFIPWLTIATVSGLGAMQIVLGGALIVSGFGASVGMGFVTEGVADLFQSARGLYTRRICLYDYAKQKAVSLVISAVSAGYSKTMSSAENAMKGLKTLGSETTKEIAKEAGREVIEQAGVTFISNGQKITQTAVDTGMNLKSLALKYIGTKMGEAAVREGLNTGVEFLANFAIDSIKPMIVESIQDRVRSMFCEPKLNALLRKMLALDTLKGEKTLSLQTKIEKIVGDTLSPESSFMTRQWDTVAVPLLKGIFASKYSSKASMGLRVIGTINGLYEIGTIMENISNELFKKLSQLDKTTLTMTQVLQEHLKIDRKQASALVDRLCELNIVDKNEDNLKMSPNDLDNDSDMSTIMKQLDDLQDKSASEFVLKLCTEYRKVKLERFSTIMKCVIDRVCEQIMRLINSQLIQPWSTLAVSAATDALSKRTQHYILVNANQNSKSQEEAQKRYEEIMEKKSKGDVISDQDKQFAENFGSFRTFEQQIDYNSQDYCLAYSQFEAKHFSTTKNENNNNEKPSEQVESRANEVEKDKPADMSEENIVAEKNGLKVKVVDSKDYKRTEEDIANGVQIVFIEKGIKNAEGEESVGHAYYMDGNGNFVDVPSKPNDCFYAVISKLLELRDGPEKAKSVEQLRKETAASIRANPDFTKALEAQQWIRERYPHQANTLLFSAGLKVEIDPITGKKTVIVEIDNIEDEDRKVYGPKKDEKGNVMKNEKGEDILEEMDDIDLLMESLEKNDRARHYKDPYEPTQEQKETLSRDNTIMDPVIETYDGADYSMHHILPNSEVENDLKNILNDNSLSKQDKKNLIQEYLNKEHIKERLLKEPKFLQNERHNHGRIQHAAVSHNPNNRVFGPTGKKRANDPGNKIDKEIAALQSNEWRCIQTNYLKAKTPIERFRAFTNLPQTTQLKWERKKEGRRGNKTGPYIAQPRM